MRSDGELILCTVIVSAPEYGLAILDTYGGTAETKERLLGFLPYSDATCGALLQLHIQEGSTVVCMRSVDIPRTAFVLTPVNRLGADMTDTLNGHVFYATNKFSTWDEFVFNAALDDLKDFAGTYFRSHANSTDKDVLPGDVDIVNNGGAASLHIGKYVAQLKGSPLAFIDVAAIEDRIRLVASQVDIHTINTYHHIGDDVSASGVAADAAEAFGLPAGTNIEIPIVSTEEESNDLSEDTVPLFRLQSTEGPAVDGKEDLVVGFPQDVEKHTDTTVPPVLSKDRTAFSGERTIASAKGISSVKSPALQAVFQYGYHYVNSHTTAEKKLDLLTPYERSIEEPEETPQAADLDQEVMDAAINKIVDKLFTKDYLPVLMQRMMEAGLIVSEVPLSTKFTEHTEFGPSTEPAYPLPKFLKLKDPVTGQEHLYFDSTSFISQEPDGSILLKDGYGSEIRMSQGNIYISPALDLQLRPGRDMWGLISRHMCLDSQGYAIINSNKSVYLRAVGDMQLAAAADKDGHGKLTIECDDRTGSQESGLILRSLGNAAFTGHNMYVGINKGDSRTTNRVEDTDRAGTIIFDAGSQGVIMEKSNRHQINSGIFTTVVSSGQHYSALTVSGNNIGLYAQVVNMPAQLKMTPVNGSQKIGIIQNGVEQKVAIDVNSEPDIMLKETTISHGQIITTNLVLSMGTIIGKQVGGTEYFGGFQDKGDTFKPLNTPNIEVNFALSDASGAYSVQQLNQTIYQDYYIGANCFQFPVDDAYGVTQTIVIPGMAWQQTTREIVGDVASVAWEEKPITVQGSDGEVTTACYPGWAAWSSEASISQTGYENKPLKDNYITNTKKETKNA